MNLNTHVKIILIETTSQANIGSTLRAMKTMSFGDLILVNPKNFPNKKLVIRPHPVENAEPYKKMCKKR